jgi:hypothetical protein
VKKYSRTKSPHVHTFSVFFFVVSSHIHENSFKKAKNLISLLSLFVVSFQKVKNIIQWKRGNSMNFDRISLMRHDLDELKENERELDSLIETLKDLSKRDIDNKFAYVTCPDLHNINMYADQMIMVVKAPPESQLLLMDGDPPPIVLKSEKDEIDIFFCPDSTNSGGLHPAVASHDSTDSEDETSVRKHRKGIRRDGSERSQIKE